MPFITEENRIIYQQDGQTLAEITFPAFEEGVVNIDHTFVDPVLRGQGVAGQLMQHTADALRATVCRRRSKSASASGRPRASPRPRSWPPLCARWWRRGKRCCSWGITTR